MPDFEVMTIGELVAIRDALEEHLVRTERNEERGEPNDLYDIATIEDMLERAELEIARQGY
ncbi:hypothetical protein [Candidatus Macondimonas diazotrophica]|uniref:Uncharacterized protein n=1 Tax=Candidatus Macondimonas diazotrophica TaxID=2305248 RepID=A0A4Z0F5W9_9GAMM|nr:hypothetical protein [Candidatus Macondimonas diazotrophica]TFZ81633.1 hypothetical protein E4680_11665 [Candidatus Macondimonas diazotrophica]